ncbi:bifunctional diaminohydroxyphosphoribosylaminopyrimidine deaminase/5-amino-6-(5-phosphoribosylamino)uracil reductase RibD [Salinarimonas soli]|uniref:Riboflavin biosynthesis protein RibD n=1 Tax=Salinarimonas soli TaxID=1638099 RepID=A0A5B2VHC5_9HYPH|nr:bifunctional diaminohydroxyphosphoribosylaminopyrimidine deaminase/5-amino-6-(5-phosphoribosylamino)uracil reductase RibD [Salinarimonas soli]
MRLALAVGARHLGHTWPNPSVGAVVVGETRGVPIVLATGVTQAGGRPHAERVALAAAGDAARGATLYVTLEPCSHHGRTPPCVDAVIASGIARVVVALTDPDPRVSGRGAALLRGQGIAVETGILEAEAARAHRGHVKRVTRGLPALTLKLARTRDGFAAATGPRLLITGEIAAGHVHLMRYHADAIMVGSGTVAADDPRLDVRLPGLGPGSPVRVVIDSALSIDPAARLVATAREIPTWVIATEGAPVGPERILAGAGVEVMRVAADAAGRVDVAEALRLLALRGITRVFCEGGPRLADALAAADLVDEAVILTGPASLGAQGIPAVGPGLADALARRFRPVSAWPAGPDLIETFERTA